MLLRQVLSPRLGKPFSALLILTLVLVVLRIMLNTMGQSNTALQNAELRKVALLSWNIWFGNFKMAERMTVLGEIIDRMRPDIIALQEVTRGSIALLKNQSWYHRYNSIPSDITKESTYFVVILSVFPVQSWKSYPFRNSLMNRKLVTVKLDINNHIFLSVGTSHLESLGPHTRQREEQLKEAVKVLSESDNACLMGDLNLEKKFDGEIVLPYPWFDSWLSLPGNSEKNGYTWEPAVNTMMKDSPGTPQRFDRVFCKLSDFRVEKMIILGKKPGKDGVFPSDHFGLYTQLETKKRKKQFYQQAHGGVQKHLEFIRPQGHA